MKTILIIATLLYAASVQSQDLPLMFVDEDKTFAAEFPLFSVTIPQLTEAYGQPKMAINGGVKNQEIWTYYEKSQIYVFKIQMGLVSNVVIRRTGSRFAGGEQDALLVQGYAK